jgi:hypothetical protein
LIRLKRQLAAKKRWEVVASNRSMGAPNPSLSDDPVPDTSASTSDVNPITPATPTTQASFEPPLNLPTPATHDTPELTTPNEPSSFMTENITSSSSSSRSRCKFFLDEIVKDLDKIQETDVLYNLYIRLEKMKLRITGITHGDKMFKKFSSLTTNQINYRVSKVICGLRKESHKVWIPVLLQERLESVADTDFGRYRLFPFYLRIRMSATEKLKRIVIQYESSITAKVGGRDFSALGNAKYVKICLVVLIGHI